MICPYCGGKNGKNAVYCSGCYRKLEKPQKEKDERPPKASLTKPVREARPVREKPVREKPVREPKPIREKPVKEPKPVKEKPVKEKPVKPLRGKKTQNAEEYESLTETSVNEEYAGNTGDTEYPYVENENPADASTPEYIVAPAANQHTADSFPTEEQTEKNPMSDNEKGKSGKKKINANKILDADYDGYYDDVLPIDYNEDKVREGLSNDTMKKVGLIIGAAAVIIIIAVIIMLL